MCQSPEPAARRSSNQHLARSALALARLISQDRETAIGDLGLGSLLVHGFSYVNPRVSAFWGLPSHLTEGCAVHPHGELTAILVPDIGGPRHALGLKIISW